jgi:outer membrane lipoprotein-sorting protein
MGKKWGVVAVGVLLPLLTGCFKTTHAVQKTHPPSQVLTTSLDQLVKQTNARYDAIHTMTATVEIAASTGGAKEGSVTQYTAFSGHILLRKPDDLRVVLLLPIVRSLALDMASDGENFKMAIPPRSRYITGTDKVTKRSKNPLENLRPSVFFDSLMVRGLEKGQLVSVTADERIYQPDPMKKYLVQEPTYEMSFHEPATSDGGDRGVELKTLRTVHIGRASLLPFQQDIYDAQGQLETQALYENYQKFGDTEFPAKITIRRPKDQLSMTVTISKLAVNQSLDDEQFEISFPTGAKVETLP